MKSIACHVFLVMHVVMIDDLASLRDDITALLYVVVLLFKT